MAFFVAAFSIVWLALVLYVARLGIAQRRLMRQVDRLRASLAERELASQQAPREAA